MFIVENRCCSASITSPSQSSPELIGTSSITTSTTSAIENLTNKEVLNHQRSLSSIFYPIGVHSNKKQFPIFNTEGALSSIRRFSSSPFKMDSLAPLQKIRKSSAPLSSMSLGTPSSTSSLTSISSPNELTKQTLTISRTPDNTSSRSRSFTSFSTVAEASRLDKNVMLLSAITRSRYSPSNNSSLSFSNCSKRGKRGRRGSNSMECLPNPTDYYQLLKDDEKKRKIISKSLPLTSRLASASTSTSPSSTVKLFNNLANELNRNYDLKVPESAVNIVSFDKCVKTYSNLSQKTCLRCSIELQEALMANRKPNEKELTMIAGFIENNRSHLSNSMEASTVNGSCETPSDCISPEVCEKLVAISEDMNLLVRNITKEAKTLVNAEICSLFLLDKEHEELVAEVFEKNGTSDEYLTEIRMPLTQGIVGHVATTGQMMNVKNVYDHPYFYPKVDERTGFVTRNILCFPIKDSQGDLVGVAELCNKIGQVAFTKYDEQIATTFAVYCAISISHCLLYRKLQEAHRRSHMAAELLVQGSTLSIAPEDILRLTVRDIPLPTSFHPEFTRFSFVPRSIGTGDIYVEASLSMFKELGFIDKYRLRRRTLARFLLMVQKGYRDVPYHNWSHAFAVGHFCYLLIRIPSVKEALNDLERFALLVACLCHDIDHRGTTNAFQLQSKTPLAQLYSSEGSVLERHHFAQTVTILGMDECNIFEQLTRQQYQTVLDSIREIILATDIAAHLRKVSRIKQMVQEGYNSNSTDHHYLLMCLLMTASDLSDQSKDFKNSKAIAENIYKEFFSQGDLEKQMGNRPIEMMDRERACVPKIQLEFMDTVALPVFDYLSRLLPDLNSTYESLLTNRQCWLILDQILQEEGLPSGGLDYLRDIELEKKVLSRVDYRAIRAIQYGSGSTAETSTSKKKPVSNETIGDNKPTSSRSTESFVSSALIKTAPAQEMTETSSLDERQSYLTKSPSPIPTSASSSS